MLTSKHGLLGIVLLLLVSSGFMDWTGLSGKEDTHPNTITLTKERQNHILYGDRTGGGHKHGVGKPCKSEFPKDWDAGRILREVSRIAANDNLKWEEQSNGRAVAEQDVDGTVVRVVIDKPKATIITAYPINVERNPCPRKPANDNFNN